MHSRVTPVLERLIEELMPVLDTAAIRRRMLLEVKIDISASLGLERGSCVVNFLLLDFPETEDISREKEIVPIRFKENKSLWMELRRNIFESLGGESIPSAKEVSSEGSLYLILEKSPGRGIGSTFVRVTSSVEGIMKGLSFLKQEEQKKEEKRHNEEQKRIEAEILALQAYLEI